MKRLKLLSLIALLCITTQFSWAQTTLAAWNFTNLSNDWGTSPTPPTTTGSGVTVVGLTRGPGVTTLNTAAATSWGGNGFFDNVAAASQTANGAITLGNYFTFAITSNSGAMSLSGIPAYNIRRSGTGPALFKWQYSIDGTSFIDITGDINPGTIATVAGNTQAAITLSSISDLQNVPSGTTVTFRVVIWNCGNQTGNFYFNSGSTDPTLTLTGTISSTALPLTLISFKGQSENNANVLNWATANEKNVASFELERGTDARNFNKIATIKAKGNDNIADNQYSYSDDAAASTSYYRLRMVDIDGIARYSNVVVLRNGVVNNDVHVYPNPAENTLFVEGLKAKSTYRVTDIMGREVIAGITATADNEVRSIQTASLVKGFYFLQFTTENGGTQAIRFVKK